MGDKFKSEDRNKFIKYLKKKKLLLMYYIPIHLHPYFRNLGFKGMFPQVNNIMKEL